MHTTDFTLTDIYQTLSKEKNHQEAIEDLARRREELIQEAENLEARVRQARPTEDLEELEKRARQTRHQVRLYTVGLAQLSER